MSVYDFTAKMADGKEVSLSDYKGKVLIIVNTASKCGFTPQYNELQALYEKYNSDGLEILAFPCNQFMHQEPGSDQEIVNFCTLNFGVTFPVFSKIDVNGANAHPLFVYLKKQSSGILGGAVKWNFTKFLVDANGQVVERFSPTTSPLKLSEKIEGLLKGAHV